MWWCGGYRTSLKGSRIREGEGRGMRCVGGRRGREDNGDTGADKYADRHPVEATAAPVGLVTRLFPSYGALVIRHISIPPQLPIYLM